MCACRRVCVCVCVCVCLCVCVCVQWCACWTVTGWCTVWWWQILRYGYIAGEAEMWHSLQLLALVGELQRLHGLGLVHGDLRALNTVCFPPRPSSPSRVQQLSRKMSKLSLAAGADASASAAAAAPADSKDDESERPAYARAG